MRHSRLSILILPMMVVACDRGAPTSAIPKDQAATVARIESHAPTTAPPRRGGVMMPGEAGRQIREQNLRPPTPDVSITVPPSGA